MLPVHAYAHLKDHPEHGPLHHWRVWPTELPPRFSDSFQSDSYHNNVRPPEGFVYPEVGTEVVCTTDYQTPAHKHGLISGGSVGRVVGIRLPFSKDGYVGCVMAFDCIAKAYVGGVVIPWDYAADPKAFTFRKASAPACQPG
jgi:hypothetical protein